jgi:hypothetical protein
VVEGWAPPVALFLLPPSLSSVPQVPQSAELRSPEVAADLAVEWALADEAQVCCPAVLDRQVVDVFPGCCFPRRCQC